MRYRIRHETTDAGERWLVEVMVVQNDWMEMAVCHKLEHAYETLHHFGGKNPRSPYWGKNA